MSMLRAKKFHKTIYFSLGILSLPLLYSGLNYFNEARLMARGEEALKAGYFARAAHFSDQLSLEVTTTERGCKLALKSYQETKQFQKMALIAESCHFNKVYIPHVFLSLAFLKQKEKKHQDAIDILQLAITTLGEQPEFYLQIGLIAKEAGDKNLANFSMQKMADLSPDNPEAQYLAFEHFFREQLWPIANALAHKLKSSKKAQTPKTKLMLARTFLQSGNPTLAQTFKDDALAGLELAPKELKRKMLYEYQDLFPPSQGQIPVPGERTPANK